MAIFNTPTDGSSTGSTGNIDLDGAPDLVDGLEEGISEPAKDISSSSGPSLSDALGTPAGPTVQVNTPGGGFIVPDPDDLTDLNPGPDSTDLPDGEVYVYTPESEAIGIPNYRLYEGDNSGGNESGSIPSEEDSTDNNSSGSSINLFTSIIGKEHRSNLSLVNNLFNVKPISHELIIRNNSTNSSVERSNINTLHSIKENYIQNIQLSNSKRFFLDNELSTLFQDFYLDDIQNINENINNVNLSFDRILTKKTELFNSLNFANKAYNFFYRNPVSNSIGKISRQTLNTPQSVGDARFKNKNLNSNIEINNINFNFSSSNFIQEFDLVSRPNLQKVMTTIMSRQPLANKENFKNNRTYNTDRLIGQCLLNLSYCQDSIYKDSFSFDDYEEVISGNESLSAVISDINNDKFEKYPVLHSKSILSYQYNNADMLNPIIKYNEDFAPITGIENLNTAYWSNLSNASDYLSYTFAFSLANLKLKFKNSLKGSFLRDFFKDYSRENLLYNSNIRNLNNYPSWLNGGDYNGFAAQQNSKLFNIFNFSAFDLLISTGRITSGEGNRSTDTLNAVLSDYNSDFPGTPAFIKLKNAITLDIHEIKKDKLDEFEAAKGLKLKKAQKILMSPRFTYQANPVSITKKSNTGNDESVFVNGSSIRNVYLSRTESQGVQTFSNSSFLINLEKDETYNLSRFECGTQDRISREAIDNNNPIYDDRYYQLGVYFRNTNKISKYSRSFVFDNSSTCFLHIPFATKVEHGLLDESAKSKTTSIAHSPDFDLSLVNNNEQQIYLRSDIASENGVQITAAQYATSGLEYKYDIFYFNKVRQLKTYLKNSFNHDKFNDSLRLTSSDPIKKIQTNSVYLDYIRDKKEAFSNNAIPSEGISGVGETSGSAIDFGSVNFNLSPTPGFVLLKNTLKNISIDNMRDKFLKFEESFTSEDEDYNKRISMKSSQVDNEFQFHKEMTKNIFSEDQVNISNWGGECIKIKKSLFKVKSKSIKNNNKSTKVFRFLDKIKSANKNSDSDMAFLYGDSEASLFKKEKSDFLTKVSEDFYAKNNYSDVYNNIRNTFALQMQTGLSGQEFAINEDDYKEYLNDYYPGGPLKNSSSYMISVLKSLKKSLLNLKSTSSSATAFTKMLSDVCYKNNDNIDIAKVVTFASLCYLNNIDPLEDKGRGFSKIDYENFNSNLKNSYGKYIKSVFNSKNVSSQKSYTLRVVDFPYAPNPGLLNSSIGSLPGLTVNLNFNKSCNFIVHSPGRIINEKTKKGLISIDVLRHMKNITPTGDNRAELSDIPGGRFTVGDDLRINYDTSDRINDPGEDPFDFTNKEYNESNILGTYNDIFEHYSNHTYNYDVYVDKITGDLGSDILYSGAEMDYWSDSVGLAGEIKFIYRRDTYDSTPDSKAVNEYKDEILKSFSEIINDPAESDLIETFNDEGHFLYRATPFEEAPPAIMSERSFQTDIEGSLQNSDLLTAGSLLTRLTSHRNDAAVNADARKEYSDVDGRINYRSERYVVPDRLFVGHDWLNIGGQDSFIISLFNIINSSLSLMGPVKFNTIEEIYDFIDSEKEKIQIAFEQVRFYCKLYSFFFENIFDMSINKSIDDIILKYNIFKEVDARQIDSDQRKEFGDYLKETTFNSSIVQDHANAIQEVLNYFEEYLVCKVGSYNSFYAFYEEKSKNNYFTSSITELFLILNTLHNSDVIESLTHDIVYSYLDDYNSNRQDEIDEILSISSFLQEKVEENFVDADLISFILEKTRLCKLSKYFSDFAYYHDIAYSKFNDIDQNNQEAKFRKIIEEDKAFFNSNKERINDLKILSNSALSFVGNSVFLGGDVPVSDMDIIRLGIDYNLAEILKDEKVLKIKVNVFSLKHPEVYFKPLYYYYSPMFTSIMPSAVSLIEKTSGYSLTNSVGYYNINEKNRFKMLYGIVNYNDFSEICAELYDKASLGRRNGLIESKEQFVSTFYNRLQHSNAVEYIDYFRGQNFSPIGINEDRSYHPDTKLGKSAEDYLTLIDDNLFLRIFNHLSEDFYSLVEDFSFYEVSDFFEIVKNGGHSIEYFKLMSKHISESQIYDLFNENKYFDIFNVVIEKKNIINNLEVLESTGLTRNQLINFQKQSGVGDSFKYIIEAEVL